MTVTRRVFVSMPADQWLTDAQNDLKWGIVEKIEAFGYIAEIFFDPRGTDSLSASRSWSADGVDEIMSHCVGAAVIGLPRWVFGTADEMVHLPTEFSYYEGAVARTVGVPLLILVEEHLLRRVVFDNSFGPYIVEFPEDADRQWLETKAFEVAFGYWVRQLGHRRDIFLGYCGASSHVAEQILTYLEQEVGATVLDWRRDFKPGRSILDQIEEARVRCTVGVFLFTKDDLLADQAPGIAASPRDNVVFEAGYFASAKGKQKVLIIREVGAKMPADLGGDIYASLESRDDLSGVESTLRQFLGTL